MKEARDVNSLVSFFQQATIKTMNCKEKKNNINGYTEFMILLDM